VVTEETKNCGFLKRHDLLSVARAIAHSVKNLSKCEQSEQIKSKSKEKKTFLET